MNGTTAKDPQRIDGAGTRQDERFPSALRTDDLPLDGWGFEEQLGLCRRLAQELRFVSADPSQPTGDWLRFLPDGRDAETLLQVLESQGDSALSLPIGTDRPHQVLLWIFLKLFGQVRDELHRVADRHLEFYLHEVLSLERRGGVGDRVDLALTLTPRAQPVTVPAGSLVSAGPDGQGRERLYATERELVVSQARLEEIRCVWLDREYLDLPGARRLHRNAPRELGLAMLRLALGEPTPGDALPPLNGHPLDWQALGQLQILLDLAGDTLHLEFFELRELFELYASWQGSDAAWQEIFDALEGAGRRRDGAFALDRTQPKDFHALLLQALGGKAPDFGALPEVESMADVYRHRQRQDVIRFIEETLFFTEPEVFAAMMQHVLRLETIWRVLGERLETAGRRRDPALHLSPRPSHEPGAFNAWLQKALEPDFSSLEGPWAAAVDDVQSYVEALRHVEVYFQLNLEEIAWIIPILHDPKSSDGATWPKVDAVLVRAHQNAFLRRRRRQLADRWRAHGWRALLKWISGMPEEDDSDLDEVLEELALWLSESSRSDDIRRLQHAGMVDAALAANPGARRGELDRLQEVDGQVLHLLEGAWRRRQGKPLPLPKRHTWLQIHRTDDAPTSHALPVQGNDWKPWRTLGPVEDERLELRDSVSPVASEPCIGGQVCSPLLDLAGGRRNIEVIWTVTEKEPGYRWRELISGDLTRVDSPWSLDLSTAEGWWSPSLITAQVTDLGPDPSLPVEIAEERWRVHLVLELSAEAPPIAPCPGDDKATLRWRLRPVWDAAGARFQMAYREFRTLQLLHLQLRVTVADLAPTLLENDAGPLPTDKPFEPFGVSPEAGSRLYVGHPELVVKPLETLTLRPIWMGLPDDLSVHYKNYGLEAKDGGFVVDVGRTRGAVTVALHEARRLLSLAGRSAQPKRLEIVSAGDPPLPDVNRRFSGDLGDSVRQWPRAFYVELRRPDFQHTAYPDLARRLGQDLGMALSRTDSKGTVDAEAYVIQAPYTPKLQHLWIEYCAVADLQDGAVGHDAPTSGLRLQHYHPFGVADVVRGEAGIELLPSYEHDGALYMGFSGIDGAQGLDLGIQLVEASADPDLGEQPVRWSVLDGDTGWRELGHDQDAGTVDDGTHGWLQSGTVHLQLPPVAPSSILPGDLTWLRVAVQHHSRAISDTVHITPHVVRAALQSPDPDGDLEQPLPAERITRLRRSLPGIASVTQSFPSHGARLPEDHRSFVTRAVERLRHKDRAVTAWDYERLVLDAFPEVYRAYCAAAGVSSHSAVRPGRVQLVILPKVEPRSGLDRWTPKAPLELLHRIRRWITPRLASGVELEVTSARFVYLKVRVAVRFRSGVRTQTMERRVHDGLRRFFAPWLSDAEPGAPLSGRIYSHQLVDFLERVEGVEYVARLQLYRSLDGDVFEPATEQDAQGGTFAALPFPDGVWAAAAEHTLDVVPDAGYDETLWQGIGAMALELDFIVA